MIQNAAQVPKDKNKMAAAATSTSAGESTNGVRPKVKLVRESSAQTTPMQTPTHQAKVPSTEHTGSGPNSVSSHNSADYKTIVRVYDNPGKDADILAVFSEKQGLLSPIAEHDGSVGREQQQELMHTDQFAQRGAVAQAMQSTSSEEHVYSRIHSQHMLPPHQNTNPGILLNQKPMSSDTDSDMSAAKNSEASFNESFHVKALNAIKALDDVVAGEHALMSENLGSSPTLPPPPPPPPLAVPPPPPPGEHEMYGFSKK